MNQFETNSKTDCGSILDTEDCFPFNVLFYKIKIMILRFCSLLLKNILFINVSIFTWYLYDMTFESSKQISSWNLPWKFLSSNHDILISPIQQLINEYGCT